MQSRFGTYDHSIPAGACLETSRGTSLDARFSPEAKLRLLASNDQRQEREEWCSVACATILINTALGCQGAISQDDVLKLSGSREWKAAVAPGGPGIDLGLFRHLLVRTFERVGFANTLVDEHHLFDCSALCREKLKSALLKSRRHPGHFMVANFSIATLRPAPGGDAGHFAIIVGYDEARERLLLLDPDPETPRPYWVPLDRLLKAMTKKDENTGVARGYLEIIPR